MGEGDRGLMEEGYPYPAAPRVPLRIPRLSPGKGMPMGRALDGVWGRRRQEQEVLPDLLPCRAAAASSRQQGELGSAGCALRNFSLEMVGLFSLETFAGLKIKSLFYIHFFFKVADCCFCRA